MKKQRRRAKWAKNAFVLPGTGNRGVKVPDGSPEAIEKALRTLKRQMKDEGVVQEMRDRREYTKPSAERREKMKEAKRRNAKEVARQKRLDAKKVCWTILTENGPV
jgi:small subunit ribosomal protein S21